MSGADAREDRFATEVMAGRLLACWDAASATELAEGLSWFEDADAMVQELAERYERTPAEVAAVIAILSPRVKWHQNIISAASMLEAAHRGDEFPPVVSGTYTNVSKAWGVLHSPNNALSRVRGRKVTAFFRALSGDKDAVTVDVWAQRAAEGQRFQPHSPTEAEYERIEAAYRMAAEARGVTAREMQAAVWIHIRNKG